MIKGDKLIPSFTLDASGIEKKHPCIIEDIDGDLHYVRTGFNILYPVHINKIVDQAKFDQDAVSNYKSKTWVHITE
ncbi:MAG: hypothetical protein HN576_07985 [Bacteriovoracaceae bacterium]|jgi:hypothetical protein|nr:hypothetical protein [Bacteriovoracaceae bacterium]